MNMIGRIDLFEISNLILSGNAILTVLYSSKVEQKARKCE
jgi:hypothetical protein